MVIPWLNLARNFKVIVVGDVILDEYLEGEVNRISPEAPVPVHLVTATSHSAGGAANAARNIRLAGGDVVLLSVVGDDPAATDLLTLLNSDEIDTKYIQVSSDRPTTRKMRVTSASHQMLRIDWERVHPISNAEQNRLFQSFEQIEADALLISDYSKGLLPPFLVQRLLESAATRGIPSVVDPKGRDFAKYRGATILTPNRKEACDALGFDPSEKISGEELGRRLQKQFGLKNVLVTLGPKGMVWIPNHNDPTPQPVIAMPAAAREVYDVSGAGDTVAAIISLSLAARAQIDIAMHLANIAAGVVVGKWGTQPIRLNEIKDALAISPHPSTDAAHQEALQQDM